MKLYKITTKDNKTNEIFSFNVGAVDIVEAIKKFQQISDIDYLYSETEDELTITCAGDLIL